MKLDEDLKKSKEEIFEALSNDEEKRQITYGTFVQTAAVVRMEHHIRQELRNQFTRLIEENYSLGEYYEEPLNHQTSTLSEEVEKMDQQFPADDEHVLHSRKSSETDVTCYADDLGIHGEKD